MEIMVYEMKSQRTGLDGNEVQILNFKLSPCSFHVPFLILVWFYSHLPAYEDGTDRVFRNVGI